MVGGPKSITAQLITAITSASKPVPVRSGDPACSDWPTPAPVIDAYKALLSLDAADPISPVSVANSPVRFAILDTNDGGAIDPDAALLTPSEPDYGRYDLNGDGGTGGVSTATATRIYT